MPGLPLSPDRRRVNANRACGGPFQANAEAAAHAAVTREDSQIACMKTEGNTKQVRIVRQGL